MYVKVAAACVRVGECTCLYVDAGRRCPLILPPPLLRCGWRRVSASACPDHRAATKCVHIRSVWLCAVCVCVYRRRRARKALQQLHTLQRPTTCGALPSRSRSNTWLRVDGRTAAAAELESKSNLYSLIVHPPPAHIPHTHTTYLRRCGAQTTRNP